MKKTTEYEFNNLTFSKRPPFRDPVKLFLPELIPKVAYASKIAIGISDILSFWSML